jgi:hypothetical protein
VTDNVHKTSEILIGKCRNSKSVTKIHCYIWFGNQITIGLNWLESESLHATQLPRYFYEQLKSKIIAETIPKPTKIQVENDYQSP